MSDLVPVSRASMQGLKAKKDEEQRLRLIKGIVYGIYREAIQAAEKTDVHFSTNEHLLRNIPAPYNTAATMKEIVSELETLFPDCSVKHKQMGRGREGKLYDLSNLDEKFRPLVSSVVECIVVDWS